jgi:very-short-patch-repair endonuclease
MRNARKIRFARQLRAAMTDAEQALWRRLRRKQIAGCRFRRQHPVGPYIADFACLERGLLIEVDGGQHQDCTGDARRYAWLRARGFTVLRFWNNDVLQDPDSVCEAILLHLCDPRPHPGLPPQAGEGDQQGQSR